MCFYHVDGSQDIVSLIYVYLTNPFNDPIEDTTGLKGHLSPLPHKTSSRARGQDLI
jgi:hypothetical protein